MDNKSNRENRVTQDSNNPKALRAYRMGFQRVAIISIHGPNNSILYLCARSIFEKYHIPALFINDYKPFDEASAELFGGADSDDKEASLVLAALRILGQPGLYRKTKAGAE